MAIPELTTEVGVCVTVVGPLGKMFVCSLYCKFGGDIAHDIDYLERVVEAAGSSPLIVGLDANAVSNMWFSKGDLRYGDKVQRGALLEDFVGQQNLGVMNCPSQFYTFCSRGGRSDIDVTLGNQAWDSFRWTWEVVPDWAHSDHNPVLITVRGEHPEDDQRAGDAELPRWTSTRDVDWNSYEEALRDRADVHIIDFNDMDVDQMADTLTGWITGANDDVLKKAKRTRLRRVNWWTPELTGLRRVARRKRRLSQTARRDQLDTYIWHKKSTQIV